MKRALGLWLWLVPLATPVFAQGSAETRVIGLLEVPELMPADSCQVFPAATVPLHGRANSTRLIGHLRGTGRPTATPCEFPEVRSEIGGISQPVAAAEHGYEERSLIVTAVRRGWYRIRTGGTPAVAWLRATPRSVYRPLVQLYTDGLTYLDVTWDRRLHSRPNGPVRLLPRSLVDGQPVQTSVRVDALTVVDGVHWARVTLIADVCNGGRAIGEGRGWVKVHGEGAGHEPVLWFSPRGC